MYQRICKGHISRYSGGCNVEAAEEIVKQSGNQKRDSSLHFLINIKGIWDGAVISMHLARLLVNLYRELCPLYKVGYILQ